MPPNYQLGKIYKIESNQCEQVYVGSTVQPLHVRFGGHKVKYKRYLSGKEKYATSSSKLLEYDDAKIYLIEKFPCDSKEELNARERYWIKELDCVNKVQPTRTRKEYLEDNKDKIRDKRKQYSIDNADKIKEYKKAWYQDNADKKSEKTKCDLCGKEMRRDSILRHKKNIHKEI